MPASLKLEEFSDRELLFVIEDVAGPDGWTTAYDVAEKLNLSAKHPVHCVSSRFAWLRRWEVLDRYESDDDEDRGTIYHRLTTEGKEFLHGTLNKRENDSLNRLSGDKMLYVAQFAAAHYQTLPDAQAKLMAREWRYGVAHRNGSPRRGRRR